MPETPVIRRIETAINDALHPKGMSTHDGIARVQAADLQYLLRALAAAQAENEALKRDAERYQWLREGNAHHPILYDRSNGEDWWKSGEDLDAAIDALRSK